VADDWRLTAEVDDGVGALVARLREREVEAEAHRRLGGAVAISADGGALFAYADSRDAIHEAKRIFAQLLEERGLDATLTVHRWHELEERWEDEDVPLPVTATERDAEHARLEADEAAESRQTNRALWEVRLDLPSHGEARELARRLEGEGFVVTRRWKYLLVGADNEDDARALGERLRGEIPADASLTVEPTVAMAGDALANPFAIFGGLGT
jgi:hypothetical protein